jgi:ATP-dependent Lon protease
VRSLKADMRGPILCFAGPPGVGKTSLGQSIARALGRKFVRVSLGGVRDEAEIRGHRRTYVGALPGRVVQGLRRAGSANPVFMLDEVDKLGADFRGDPAAGLLEVLDPEQNSTFADHYLEVAFDLSRVLFIATANELEPIPPALRDRMEVITLSGYTQAEKRVIARTHLLPKQLAEHGLSHRQLTVSDAALRTVVAEYTREAGVRNLDRTIAALCRKAAVRIARGELRKVTIGPKALPELLGPPPFRDEALGRRNEVGVAAGLAVTPVGGDVLVVEAVLVPGSGHLSLTGSLGDVMRESAKAAWTYARAHAGDLGADPEFYKVRDVHVHVPAGAIPKDGPSAGVTMAAALVSAVTRRPVRRDVAMTGEITLRGRVLPVGGIKDKVLAAHRAGARTVVLPKANEKDLADVPPEVLDSLTIVLAEEVADVLDATLAARRARGR